MKVGTGNSFTVLILVVALAVPAFPQGATNGTVTGRAEDISGALIPGVEVTVASPAMIQGSRTAITNETGSYRFTQLPGGDYTVSFSLPGFATMNIEGVTVLVGATATVNGTMEVATVAETITVTSQEPTIDLEQATVAVNFSDKEFEDVPYSRSLRGLMMMIPGVFATAYDVGGSSFGTGSSSGGQAFGKSGDAQVVVDGMVWDQHYEDFGSFDEVQVTTAAKSAEQSNPGTSMSFVIKGGSNEFHGEASADWTDSSFVSKNIDQDLLNRGFTAGSNSFTRYNDFFGNIGGPIIKDRAWFMFSHRDGYGGSLIPGFVDDRNGADPDNGPQATFWTKLKDPTLKLNFQLTDNLSYETMVQFGRKWQAYRGGNRTHPLTSTQNQDSWSLIGPTFKFAYIISPTMTLDWSASRGGYWWPSIPYTQDIRQTDRNSGETRGNYFHSVRKPVRWQWGANFSVFANLGETSHELKTGYQGSWGYSSSTDQLGYVDHSEYRYRSSDAEEALGQYFLNPDSVRIQDTPTLSKNGESYDNMFIQDKITVNRNLTLNLGMRWDRYTSWLPEQGNNGSGPYATANLYPAKGPDQFPVYNSIVPRLSMVYDITGEGRVALKAGYGRYAGSDSGSGILPGAAAGNINPSSTTRWTYNWDGSIPYVPNPADLTSVTGGGGEITETLASDLKAPKTDEFSLGIDLGLSRDYSFRFNIVRKIDFNNQKRIDPKLPFSAYTGYAEGIDRGQDNIVGTADDRTLSVWSVPRSNPNFGSDFEHTINTVGKEGEDVYTGFEMTFNKQFSDGLSFMVSFTSSLRKTRVNDAQNPNDLLYDNSQQFSERNGALKANAIYELPWGFQYSTSLLGQSEDWYNREVQIRNALGSRVTFDAERHVGRLPWVNIWDNRISKTFEITDRQEIEATFDLFNSINSNNVIRIRERVGSRFLEPRTVLPPRVFRLGIRYRF